MRPAPLRERETALSRLHDEQGQSPWLDDLRRSYLLGDDLSTWVTQGIRGVTSNPAIFQRAIAGSTDYDAQFTALTRAGHDIQSAFWAMVVDDITNALGVLRPVFDASNRTDGFVSVELAPDLARDTDASVAAARGLHDRIEAPNLYVKIPATAEGIPAIRRLVSEGRNINVALVFGLTRYDEVIEAYLAGLEEFAARSAGRPGRSRERRVVLRQPSRHRGRPTACPDRHSRSAGLAGPDRDRPGQAGLPAVPPALLRTTLGGTGRPRRPGAATTMGIHRH